MLVTECMDDITSHLASCHLSKCSKCDCGRGVVHVYEKYSILAIKVIFLNLNSV